MQLLYNIVLVSSLQQSESAICIHLPPLSWACLPHAPPTPPGHHRAWNWAPCGIQKIPTSYLFYTWQCIHVNSTLSIHPAILSPTLYPHIFSLCLYLLICLHHVAKHWLLYYAPFVIFYDVHFLFSLQVALNTV